MKYFDWNEQHLTTEVKEQALRELARVVEQCRGCDLCESVANKVFSDGVASAKIMLIGEAPGADEDSSGVPFVGRAGKYLSELLKEVGISRDRDIYIVNTVKCRPPENRNPNDFEKDACRDFLLAQINIVKPKVIILCGAVAVKSFVKYDFKITKLRGEWMKLFNGRIPAMAIFHPSYLLRNHSEEAGSPRELTRMDLKKIKEYVDAGDNL